MTIYATPSGRRYHGSPFCEGLNSWYSGHFGDETPPIITRQRALQRNLQPCKTCKPSPLLSVVTDTR